MNKISKKSGQFMLEVLVAVGVVVLLATGLVAGTTASLRSNQKSRQKSEAVRYIEDGMEIVRSNRDNDPSDFFSRAAGTYCLGDGIGTNLQFSGSCTTPNISDTDYIRVAIIADSAAGKDVTVKVSWPDGSTEASSQVNSTFTTWKTPGNITMTPTPTPVPKPVIRPNIATGLTCAEICAPGQLISCGTDAAASNGRYSRRAPSGCATALNCERVMYEDGNVICFGKKARWTNCLCLVQSGGRSE